jgi:hypothetical protein
MRGHRYQINGANRAASKPKRSSASRLGDDTGIGFALSLAETTKVIAQYAGGGDSKCGGGGVVSVIRVREAKYGK